MVQLVVAEKPSVARDLARVLGVRSIGQHWFESSAWVITWCVGHLVELDEPAAYDSTWKAWRMDTLPMLPKEFRLRPANHAVPQLRAVTRLLADRRFTVVVNACDAGREGELIFRYVYRYAGSGLPVRRLWISSLTDEAIRRGFATLRPGPHFDALGDAARSRSEADWLVGMNATRAVTVRRRVLGNSTLLSIGRVQTPTLAMLVHRERAIVAFVPRNYWEVRGEFRTAAGHKFLAGWQHHNTARLATSALAEAIVTRSRAHSSAAEANGPRVEKLRAKSVKEPAPLLFDLTSLQRTANKRFGMSAARTLEVAQALYEKHKLLTYPRTDSRYLTTDVVTELPALFAALAMLPDYTGFASELVATPPRPGRRVVDNSKVHDHHAIIPTNKTIRRDSADALGLLGRDERRLYDLVVRRFLGVFYPDAEFAVTEVLIRVGVANGSTLANARVEAVEVAPTTDAQGDAVALENLPEAPDLYLARGRVRVVAGWQLVAGIGHDDAEQGHGSQRDAGDSKATLPAMVEGETLDGTFALAAKQTTAPPRYTEATLLGAMESAGKSMDDEAVRLAMKDCGLGTPATRAAVIETLLKRDYVVRDKQQLIPTTTGVGLIEALPVASLGSPELTGQWEARLARISRGEESRRAFMADIEKYVREIIDTIRDSPLPPEGLDRADMVLGIAARTRGGGPVGLRSARHVGRRGTASSPKTRRSPAASPRPPSTPRGRGTPSRESTKRSTQSPRQIEKRALSSSDPATAVAGLACPRCGVGSLMCGARGWGCSRWRDGCGFVIWFETAGRRLSATQLRDLVVRGKTRKARFLSDGGLAIKGRLVLDLSANGGSARLEPA